MEMIKLDRRRTQVEAPRRIMNPGNRQLYTIDTPATVGTSSVTEYTGARPRRKNSRSSGSRFRQPSTERMEARRRRRRQVSRGKDNGRLREQTRCLAPRRRSNSSCINPSLPSESSAQRQPQQPSPDHCRLGARSRTRKPTAPPPTRPPTAVAT